MEITDNVYYIGVQNPNLRVFDIIMKTDYGTSYNSYLIKSDKIAIIETVHEDFFDEFIGNIQKYTTIDKIDYVVINHTELDHTGSLKKLLELNPNIEVISSAAGQKYLTKILNSNFNSKIVKTADTLNLGEFNLEFIISPLLHWPDSMFTYLKEKEILFSCDFLGCHYCEPGIFDTKIKYKDYYNDAFLYYYEAIFSPFKEFVLKGLKNIENISIKTICPSHGPVLTQNIDKLIDIYRNLSICKEKNNNKNILILYASAYGCTEKLANIAKNTILTNTDFDVCLINVINSTKEYISDKLNSCDGLMIGSPTINKVVVEPITETINMISPINFRKKPAAVFGSFGWSGEAIKNIVDTLNNLSLLVCGEGFKCNFVPNEDEIKQMENYTNEFIKLF